MLMKVVVVSSLMLTLQLTSLNALYKFLGDYAGVSALVMLLAAAAVYSAMMHPVLGRRYVEPICRGPWVAAVVIAAIVLVSLLLYPVADALKEHMGGSDRDDAVIVGVRALFDGEYPYGKTTYFGSWLSPGPGLLLLYAPFVGLDLYALGAGASLATCAFLLKRQHDSWVVASLFLLLAASSLLFWQELATGSDLIFVGSCFLGILLVLQHSDSRRTIFLCAVLCGVISTSRVVFLYIPFLIGVPLWLRSKGDAIKFVAISSVVAVGLHAAFYLWAPDSYTPLHILSQGRGLLAGNFMYLFVAICLIAGGFIVRAARRGPDSWVAALFLGLVTPLFMLAVAGLRVKGWQLQGANPANYLTPALPACCAYAAIRIRQSWLAGK